MNSRTSSNPYTPTFRSSTSRELSASSLRAEEIVGIRTLWEDCEVGVVEVDEDGGEAGIRVDEVARGLGEIKEVAT